MPTVSIGLPVYNGERYLEAALDAILVQTFTNFEVIICDNASTDRTEAICQAYMAGDERIHYHRNAENIGAAPNFNRTFELATGEYFKWVAADDLIAPDYLEQCVSALEQNPDAALCYTKVKVIDDSAKVVGEHLVELQHPGAERASVRFGEFIRFSPTCFQVFGLYRASVLAQTPLIASHIGSDKSLIAEINLRGPLIALPDPLFFSRQHAERSVKLDRDKLAGWYDASQAGRSKTPNWRKWQEFRRALQRVPLSRRERIASYGQLALWPFTGKNWALLALDLISAILPGSWQHLWKLDQRLFRTRGYSTKYFRYYDESH